MEKTDELGVGEVESRHLMVARVGLFLDPIDAEELHSKQAGETDASPGEELLRRGEEQSDHDRRERKEGEQAKRVERSAPGCQHGANHF